MSIKALLGFTVIPAAILGGLVAACLSKRIRDLFFMLLVFLSPMIERLDVNFFSHEWYRGTSRGFEVSLLDVLALSLLGSSVLAPRRGESRGYWPASLGLMLLFFLYSCANVAISDPQLFGLFELFKMLRAFILVLAVAFYLRSERELRLLIFSLGMLVCYEGLLALEQRYVEGQHRVPGSIDDSNSLSVFLCLTTPIFVAAFNSRIPKLLKLLCILAIPLASVAMILTISRAGVVILGLVLAGVTLWTVSYRLTPRRIAMSLVIILAATGVMAKSWKTLHARFEESSLKDEYANKRALGRGYYIRVARAIAADQWFGVGLNNWSYWVSNKYGPRLGYRFVPYSGVDTEPSDVIPPGSNVDEAQAAPAHSLGALTLGELGLPGLVLFSLLWLRWFQMGASFLWPRTADPMRRMGVGLFFAFLGIFLQSQFEWVFRHSPIFYEFHILLGCLASLYYVKKKEKRLLRAQLKVAPIENLQLEPCWPSDEAVVEGAKRVFSPAPLLPNQGVLTESAGLNTPA